MPGQLLHVEAGVQCFHAAKATVSPGSPKVLVGGKAVVTTTSQVTVSGCPFQVPAPSGSKPQPCVSVKWGSVATKVFVDGKAVLLGPTTGTVSGICQSAEGIPQGSPTITSMQSKVSGT